MYYLETQFSVVFQFVIWKLKQFKSLLKDTANCKHIHINIFYIFYNTLFGDSLEKLKNASFVTQIYKLHLQPFGLIPPSDISLHFVKNAFPFM
jgi:hypothetical protein